MMQKADMKSLSSAEDPDILHARRVLDAEITGLEKLKAAIDGGATWIWK